MYTTFECTQVGVGNICVYTSRCTQHMCVHNLVYTTVKCTQHQSVHTICKQNLSVLDICTQHISILNKSVHTMPMYTSVYKNS